MYEKQFISAAVRRSTTTEVDRRRLFALVGLAGAGAAVATAASAAPAFATGEDAGEVTDAAVLNFALNLEYLEAEFYLRAVTGQGLNESDTTGTGARGGVSVRRHAPVPFRSRIIRNYAREIAKDEQEHVRFLRAALGGSAVARPAIDLDAAFTAAARAAKVIGPKDHFDAFKNDLNFLLAAFLFEDVGVTAYKGAAPLITNKTYLGAAAGILAVEAYHAGAIRTSLYDMAYHDHPLFKTVQKLSNARDSLDGPALDDQGIGSQYTANIIPTDGNGIAFGRTPDRVLNIVYLTPEKATSGGFYPKGVNGSINTSGPAS